MDRLDVGRDGRTSLARQNFEERTGIVKKKNHFPFSLSREVRNVQIYRINRYTLYSACLSVQYYYVIELLDSTTSETRGTQGDLPLCTCEIDQF